MEGSTPRFVLTALFFFLFFVLYQSSEGAELLSAMGGMPIPHP